MVRRPPEVTRQGRTYQRTTDTGPIPQAVYSRRLVQSEPHGIVHMLVESGYYRLLRVEYALSTAAMGSTRRGQQSAEGLLPACQRMESVQRFPTDTSFLRGGC